MERETFATRVTEFNRNLFFSDPLPENIRIMNPFRDNPEILPLSERFYHKFYNDRNPRKMILGINPGRLGAGVTGIPFTDTKRMQAVCGIKVESAVTHEPSSVFVYDVIRAYGGPEKFYGEFYIHSICPLGFIIRNPKGNWVNCNYYDDKALLATMYPFMVKSLREQLEFGIDRERCFVLGKKNARFIQEINKKEHFFKQLLILEHPRYIAQYRSREVENYVARYLEYLTNAE